MTGFPPLTTATTEDLSRSYRALQQPLLQWFGAGSLVSVAFVASRSFDQALALALILAACWSVLVLWERSAGLELPILPVYVSFQTLLFGLPLLLSTAALDDSSGSQIVAAGFAVALWLLSLLVGWWLVQPSWFQLRPAPPLPLNARRLALLPHGLLAAGLLIDLLLSSGIYWQLAGGLGSTLLSPVRTLAAAMELIGGFLGALEFGAGRLQNAAVWWALWAAIVGQSLFSLLLSSSQAMLLSTIFGLWLASARRALPITVALLLLLAFLNQGKFVLRERYWGGGLPLPSNPIELISEWIAASTASEAAGTGQQATERLNTLQNVIFIQGQLAAGVPPMEGESYGLIPQVLVPRVLATEKVRSQEGQVRLNLHFGRQATREQTETTYIAWGFLAEALGNFGDFFGPLLVGISCGALLRLSANLGRQQLLLTSPGVISLTLLLLWVVSYEFVASTFAAAAFQWVVMYSAVIWLVRKFLPA
ncbi:hypothetical protein [Cyanobium sp. ATX 6F1]|uniref:hypothetical protein n=1 Tax=unclassified Cyanobium TaxID=2627006 RepID=UPI0020CFB332|nr:hypothetical protein [Cyanobium sp. ATX 6F1]MCP9915829.1 hypothetical protein [Cyanobium sp. ATX 6F1]